MQTVWIKALLFSFLFPGVLPSQVHHASMNGILVTGPDKGELSVVDEMMTTLLREHQVPGASLAISRNGKLVYAKGFGVCDPGQKIPVQPKTRFRIASISKPITAAAILLLVQDGKIGLDDKLDSFLTRQERSNVDASVRMITIRQLLQHRAGWDRNASFDPMFKTAMIAQKLGLRVPANQSQIVTFMLSRPLDFEPDSRYAYSNFGYCVLGRIIERVSNLPYDKYVKQHLFRPLGISGAELGRSLRPAKNESQYFDREQQMTAGVVRGVYGKQVPLQYGGWNLENMDSHGGWIASAPDLVRFADAFNTPNELFTEQSLKTAFESSKFDRSKDVYYALGWQVRRLNNSNSINTWHTGSLTGTSTILVRRYDGLNWAVLFNTRDGDNNKRMANIVDPLVHSVVNRVRVWPENEVVLE